MSSRRRSFLSQRKRRSVVVHEDDPGTLEQRPVAQLDPLKPREEYHYKEFYPDLEEEAPVQVVVVPASEPQNDQQVPVVRPREAIRYKTELREPSFRQVDEVEQLDSNKIPKNIIKLGYNDAGSTSHTKKALTRQLKPTYIRENDNFFNWECNNKIFHDISNNQLNFKCKYDMDKQDDLYLKHLIDQNYQITSEIFEIMITILENEWFYLEKKIPPKIRNVNSSKMSSIIEFVKKYGCDDGIGTEPIDEQKCAVCNESECDNSNAIIFCDGCDIAVHQDCYGVIFIPEGQWLCRRCMISKKRKINCVFCPSTTGAFKQTENGLWSHVICGIWIPELYFASAGHMEPIEGYELIPKERWKLICYICKQKMGACIQCSNRNCFLAYHTTCAKRAGLYLNMTKGMQGAIVDSSSLVSYCHKHSPPEYNSQHNIKEMIEKTRLYFNTVGACSSTMNNGPSSFKIKIRTNKNKIPVSSNAKPRWKTSKGTPIPPNYFIKVLSQFLTKLKVARSDELSTHIVKYWCMKRELKRGAPLIRRIDSTQASNGNYEEIKPKIEFSKTLLKDLDLLKELSEKVEEREFVKLQQTETENGLIRLGYFPQCIIIQNILLEKVFHIDSSKIIKNLPTKARNLVQMNQKALSNQYVSMREFVSDLDAFFQEVESTWSDNFAYTKAVERIKRELKFSEMQNSQHDNGVQSRYQSCLQLDGCHVDLAKWMGLDVMGEMELSEVDE